MCGPQCYDAVARELSHRSLIKGAVGGGAILAAGASRSSAEVRQRKVTADRIVDLTYTLTPDFPNFSGGTALDVEQVSTFANDGFNMKTWKLLEHVGTHMDAPIHCSADGLTADQIAPENLICPLVVIDIREKADGDGDAQLTPDDLGIWIGRNGPIPDGACVAMNSGWEHYVKSSKFRNADDQGVMHFPGFHEEAAEMLLSDANVAGICVDTLSLDFGRSGNFPTHRAWLPAERWGLESVANLSNLPEKGATIVVGSPKIGGATGGPTRAFALI